MYIKSARYTGNNFNVKTSTVDKASHFTISNLSYMLSPSVGVSTNTVKSALNNKDTKMYLDCSEQYSSTKHNIP